MARQSICSAAPLDCAETTAREPVYWTAPDALLTFVNRATDVPGMARGPGHRPRGPSVPAGPNEGKPSTASCTGAAVIAWKVGDKQQPSHCAHTTNDRRHVNATTAQPTPRTPARGADGLTDQRRRRRLARLASTDAERRTDRGDRRAGRGAVGHRVRRHH